MDKPASVVFQFNKADSFWSSMLNIVAKKTVNETGEVVTALLPVKSYSMDDHEFIQIKFVTTSDKELLVWIPRSIVKSIIEGKTDMRAAFSFASGKTK